MSEPHSGRPSRWGDKHATHPAARRTLFQKLIELVAPGPDSRDELIESLADAESKSLIAPESRMMLEGVIRMADMTAGDVMVPAGRMDQLDIASDYDDLLHLVIDTGHSRFPVFDGGRENVIGILMAKDLLKLQRSPDLNLRTLLRPAVFVPESKGLNELLRDFRSNRNHLAIVIDEFGSTAGLITIEDVLEEIVGEIHDEYDDDEPEIKQENNTRFWVTGGLALDELSELLGQDFVREDLSTVGGLVYETFGRVPRPGEAVKVGSYRMVVERVRRRRIERVYFERVFTPLGTPAI